MAAQRMCFITLVVTSFLPLANAQTPAPAAAKHEPALDVTSMDRSVDPCVDFFKYSCGGWIKNNPIPRDQSSWDTYSKMEDENRSRLRGILEGAAASLALKIASPLSGQGTLISSSNGWISSSTGALKGDDSK